MKTLTLTLRYLLFSLFSLLTIQVVNGQGTTQVQVNPDCSVVNATVTVTGSATITLPAGNGFDNRLTACQSYVLEYTATATSGSLTSIAFQAASGAVTPGSFANWGGTVSTGVNPNTSSVAGITTFTTGCASSTACTVANAWLNVLITPNTFIGTIKLTVYGWKEGAGGAGGGGGGGGGCTSPCPVEGTASAGSPPSGAPVQIGGSDGTDMRTIKTDNIGQVYTISSTVATSNEPLSVSASGLTQILAASGSEVITIYHISLGFASGVNFQLEYGTGVKCGTGTTALTGVYESISGIALDTPYTVPAGQALCVNLGTAVAGGGLLIYTQM